MDTHLETNRYWLAGSHEAHSGRHILASDIIFW